MKYLGPITLAIFCFATLCVAPAMGQSLQDAMRSAVANTPDMAEAELATQIAEERINQAKAQGKLQLSLESSLSWQNLESNAPFNFNVGDSVTGGTNLTATRPLYTGGRVKAGVEAARSAALAQSALKGSEEQAILYRTVEAYLGVWRDRKAVELAENARELAVSQLRQAQDSFEAGVITRTDVALAEANLAQAVAQHAIRRAQLDASAANFSYLVGGPPSDLTPPKLFLGLPADLDIALARLEAENPNLMALNLQGESLSQLTKQAKAAYRPQVVVSGSTGYGRELRDYTYESSVGAALGLSFPLYTSGQRKSSVKQSELEALKNAAEFAKTKGQLEIELTRLWQIKDASKIAINAAQSQVDALEQAFEGAKVEFEFGARPWIDVLDARQNLFTARQSLIDTQHDHLLSQAGILSLLNRINPDSPAH